jgi:hypothetical protein
LDTEAAKGGKMMDKHIETLNVMESSYAHIRKNDSEYEAIEAAKETLQEQAEREKGCSYRMPCGWCSNFDRPCEEACGKRLK